MISEVLGTAQKETPMELQDVLGQLRALANSGLPLDSEVIKRAAGEIERLCVTADGVPAVDGIIHNINPGDARDLFCTSHVATIPQTCDGR